MQETFSKQAIGTRITIDQGIAFKVTGIIICIWQDGYRVDIREENTNTVYYGILAEQCQIVNIYRILYMNKALGKPGIWGITAESEEQAHEKFTSRMRSFCEIKSIELANN
jgi:hypothetical protein